MKVVVHFLKTFPHCLVVMQRFLTRPGELRLETKLYCNTITLYSDGSELSNHNIYNVTHHSPGSDSIKSVIKQQDIYCLLAGDVFDNKLRKSDGQLSTSIRVVKWTLEKQCKVSDDKVELPAPDRH